MRDRTAGICYSVLQCAPATATAIGAVARIGQRMRTTCYWVRGDGKSVNQVVIRSIKGWMPSSVLYFFLLGGVRKKRKRNKPWSGIYLYETNVTSQTFFLRSTNPTSWFQYVEGEFGESGQETMLEVRIYSLTGGVSLYRLPLPAPPPSS